MTVQEFYEWCKERKLEDADLVINLKFAGLDMKDVPVNDYNIDCGWYHPRSVNQKKLCVRLGG